MKGDFSRWQDHPDVSFSGVLQQQGRVLLDRDWNDQVRITSNWQENMGRVMLGHDVVAVPEEQIDSSFKVTTAVKKGSQIQLTLGAGNAWLNGHSLFMKNNDIVATNLPATDYQPMQSTNSDQAVILEMWEEPVNGYQNSVSTNYDLVEPALGGPDTTERMQRCMALRLVETDGTEDCGKIAGRVKDDLSKKGHLAAGLQSSIPADDGSCPTSLPGGYTGFEHNLYRIEIAQTDAAAGAAFKWSRYNGGLTGKGTFGTQPETIRIEANLPAIRAAGNDSFYVEIVRRDSADLHWEVLYGAVMGFSEGQLTLQTKWFGAATTPAANTPVFFRLWDGIGQVGNFQNPPAGQQPQVLQDGITLSFDPENKTVGNYRPGDFWTFPVRVGQTGGTSLLTAQPPQGIVYHRAPLAVLQWNAGQANQTIDSQHGQILDMRVFFWPLTQIQTSSGKTCCTFTVGDGVTSQGDYDKLEDALAHLPSEGGQVCLLAGTHQLNVTLDKRSNIRIYGCSLKSIVKPATPGNPVFTITNSQLIQIDNLYFQETAKAIFGLNSVMKIQENWFKVSQTAIDIRFGQQTLIADNIIMLAGSGGSTPGVGMFVQGAAAVIEKNTVIASGGVGGIQIGSSSNQVTVRNNKIECGTGHGICLGHLPSLPSGTWNYYISDQDIATYKKLTGATFSEDLEMCLYDIRIEDNDISFMGQNGIGPPALFNINGSAPYTFSVLKGIIARNRITRCMGALAINAVLSTAGSTGDWQSNATYGTWGGIVLAHAEDVSIRENEILENGTSSTGVAGIFIMLAENVALDGNVLMENGSRNNSGPANVGDFDIHGGVVVRMAFQPLRSTSANLTPMENRGPALALRNNKIIQPMGPALSVTAVGPIEAVENRFVSQGLFDLSSTNDYGNNRVGVVRVVNLGLPKDAFHPFWLYSYLQLPAINTSMIQTCDSTHATGPISDPGNPGSAYFKVIPRGAILWSENTMVFDGITSSTAIYLATSQLLASYDDISYENNVSVCAPLNFCTYFNTMLFASAIRVVGNRFEEGYTQAYFSLSALGIMNTLLGNQSTHSCVALASGPNMLANANNLVVVDPCQGGLDHISGDLMLLIQGQGVVF
jgi:hypothetical protein